MELRFEQDLPVSCETAWPFIAVPSWMSRWSTARVIAELPGDGGRSDGVGATRRVEVPTPLGLRTLSEVIVWIEPPRGLVYRVFGTPPIREHLGELRLEPRGEGCRLTWTVSATLAAPWMESLARRLLNAEMGRSLSALRRLLERGVAGRRPLPAQPERLDPPESLAALYAEAEAVAAAQKAHADTLFARRDSKRWFARVYQYVTEAQIEGCRTGLVGHTGWVLRLIPVFHRYYFDDNLLPWVDGETERVESHWRVAFNKMERENDPARSLFWGMRQAIIAHIEEDLPRALAEVYAKHYATRCDYTRFRADYLLMEDLFYQASSRLVADIPEHIVPWYYRFADRHLPVEAKRFIERSRFYDVPAQRQRAFERGAAIARILVDRG